LCLQLSISAKEILVALQQASLGFKEVSIFMTEVLLCD